MGLLALPQLFNSHVDIQPDPILPPLHFIYLHEMIPSDLILPQLRKLFAGTNAIVALII